MEDIVQFDFPTDSPKIIKVIGVGGGGGNAVNHMYREGIHDVAFVVCNTDRKALEESPVPVKLQLGHEGLGAGNRPNKAKEATEESINEVQDMLNDGTKMVFITAGMGGGTGTGAAPVVAEIAQSLDKLTIAVVTKPFKFEGAKKMERAEKGIEALIKHVDALIVIPNQNLITNEMRLTMKQSYAIADEVLKTDVIAIAEIITRHDEINVDFADVTTILKGAGRAHIAIGHGEGKDKVQDIINQVISSDLLETSIKGARRLIVNVTMSEDLLISDMDELTAAIADAADDNVEIIFGNGTNPDTKDAMDVTVIAADFVDRDDVPETAAPKAATTYTANFTQKADDAKADAEAMHKAGVKAADNPNYYDDIFNIFKNK